MVWAYFSTDKIDRIKQSQAGTDSSIFGLLQLQHPLGPGQVVHLLKCFDLGGNTPMFFNPKVLMIAGRFCTSTRYKSFAGSEVRQ